MPSLGFPLAGPLGGDAADDRSNIVKLLTAIASAGVQPLWNTMQQVRFQRTLDNAVGTQLDVIGQVVDQARAGLDDDTYRRFLRATIATHRSKGTRPDLLKVIDLVIFDPDAVYVVVSQDFATVFVYVDNIEVADDLADVVIGFLGNTVSAGVRVILISSPAPPGDWFRFDSGPGFDISFMRDARDNS